MKILKKTLAIVSNEFEAKQAVEIINREDGRSVLIALSLNAEFYLKKALPAWENPLYELLDKQSFSSNKRSSVSVYKYLYPNFKIAYDFAGEGYYQYVRDRFGYFLTEIDRSLDFARKTVRKFKPTLIICGEPEDYRGASVINGSLKKNAFYLIAKSRKIPYQILAAEGLHTSFKQRVGPILQQIRTIIKQKINDGKTDLLIVATGKHAIQMAGLIQEIKNAGFQIKILTYNMTFAYKKQLDNLAFDYLEKNRLMDGKIKNDAQKIKKNLIREKSWLKFVHPKYKNDTVITEYLRKKLKRIVDTEFDEILNDCGLAKSVMDKLKPKLLLTTTDPDTRVLTFINYAKEIAVTSISLQHGIYFKVDPPSNAPESDFFITWSNLSKKTLLLNPYFKFVKKLIGQSPFHKIPFTEDLKFTKKGPLLVLTAIDMFDINQKTYYYKVLFEILENTVPNAEIIFRINPFQIQEDLRTLILNTKLNVKFDDQSDLHASIKSASVVIYENTTAGLDAMLLGKPTIYLNPYSGEDYFGVKGFDASMTILTESEMRTNLGICLTNGEKWKDCAKRGKLYAEKYLGLEKGNTNQIIGIIRKIIN